jgi:DNA repair exonuclease SbcCD ATPase subunit
MYRLIVLALVAILALPASANLRASAVSFGNASRSAIEKSVSALKNHDIYHARQEAIVAENRARQSIQSINQMRIRAVTAENNAKVKLTYAIQQQMRSRQQHSAAVTNVKSLQSQLTQLERTIYTQTQEYQNAQREYNRQRQIKHGLNRHDTIAVGRVVSKITHAKSRMNTANSKLQQAKGKLSTVRTALSRAKSGELKSRSNIQKATQDKARYSQAQKKAKQDQVVANSLLGYFRSLLQRAQNARSRSLGNPSD